MKQQKRNWDKYDYVGAIMDYEDGNLDEADALRLFQFLVDTGMVGKLQGNYGRTADSLIERKLIEPANKEQS